MTLRLLTLALLATGLSPAFAQEPAPPEPPAPLPAAAPPPDAAPAAPKPGECPPKAAIYQAEKGPKLWVTRHGTMVLAENPLRPQSRDEALVLEVVVNGRLATAYGPDANHLRQGGAVQTVEREGAEPVKWASAGLQAPALRVIAEDGRVLLGPLAFGGCEDAPSAKPIAPTPVQAEKPERPQKGRRTKTGEPETAPRAGPNLPQGALPSLSMPKSGQAR